MKAEQIVLGGHYTARVSGRLVTVRVDHIRNQYDYKNRLRTVYGVTNLRTGRKLIFHSAQKFQRATPRAYPEVTAAIGTPVGGKEVGQCQ